MAALVMPLLVLSMGSEMVFVLDQQLRAKKTTHHSRRLRELRALLCALHDRTFITALFQQTPTLQRQPSVFAMRALLGRLANAPPSLCVNARAMDILYDAICTGFKRQLLACGTDNDALLGATLNHLDATKRMLEMDAHIDEGGDNGEVGNLVDETILRTHEVRWNAKLALLLLLTESFFSNTGRRTAGCVQATASCSSKFSVISCRISVQSNARGHLPTPRGSERHPTMRSRRVDGLPLCATTEMTAGRLLTKSPLSSPVFHQRRRHVTGTRTARWVVAMPTKTAARCSRSRRSSQTPSGESSRLEIEGARRSARHPHHPDSSRPQQVTRWTCSRICWVRRHLTKGMEMT
jgi:hypothetical protein